MGITTSQEYTYKPNIPITCDLARGQTSLHPAGFELVTSKEMLFTIKPSEVLLNLMLISIKNLVLRHIGLEGQKSLIYIYIYIYTHLKSLEN